MGLASCEQPSSWIRESRAPRPAEAPTVPLPAPGPNRILSAHGLNRGEWWPGGGP